MTDPFPHVTGWQRGYAVGEVEDFFSMGRSDESMTAAQVRTVGFNLVRGGYDVRVVDAELDKLEDNLAAADRARYVNEHGEQGFLDHLATVAQTLRARAARPHGDRFPRGSAMAPSYDISQVDDACDQVAEYLDGERGLAPHQLRDVVFAPRRGSRGYAEGSVDRFLDRAVAVMTQVTKRPS